MSLNKNVMSVLTGKMNRRTLAKAAVLSKSFRDAVTTARKRRGTQRTILKSAAVMVGRSRQTMSPVSLRRYANAIRLVSHIPKSVQGYHPRQKALMLLHRGRSPRSIMGSDVYGDLLGSHLLVRPNSLIMRNSGWTTSVSMGARGPNVQVFHHL